LNCLSKLTITNFRGLLSLTGKAEHRLLLYLGASEGGGVQGLLSLRLVCRTTKGWVDNLSPRFGQRVFSRVVVRVDLVELAPGELWKSFCDSPPPSPVTSLCLDGVDGKLNKLPKSNLSVPIFWHEFMDYWSPKLKSLKVLRFPVEDCFIRNLISRSKELLEQFQCEYFFVGKYWVNQKYFTEEAYNFNVKFANCHGKVNYFWFALYFTVSEFTEFVFNLKSLRIHRLEIDEAKREWFFSKLLANKSLRDIHLSIHTVEDFDTINCMLRT